MKMSDVHVHSWCVIFIYVDVSDVHVCLMSMFIYACAMFSYGLYMSGKMDRWVVGWLDGWMDG